MVKVLTSNATYAEKAAVRQLVIDTWARTHPANAQHFPGKMLFSGWDGKVINN